MTKMVLPTVSGLKSYSASLLARKYIETHSWVAVKAYANEQNVFETMRKATSDRYANNIIKMLSVLDEQILNIIAEGTEKDRLSVLWLGFCLSFPLVGEFASCIISQKFINKSFHLSAGDLWEFIADKSIDFPNLANLSDSVRSKAKSVIFFNLKEAGLLNGQDEIQSANLTKVVKKVINLEYLVFFPGENK